MFKIGQKVVCIADSWISQAVLGMPKKDRIYTVRSNKIMPWSDVPYGIRLFEIVNTERQWSDMLGEPYFDAKFFRPLEDTEGQIELRQMEPEGV